ncbi:MAG: chromosome segregation protein SMC [Caldilineaceae bacterium]
MFIKRVLIQGFKTFAKRTDFIFESGITAVVGPNGSGKSNIVDAVRWCLGEQSFSLLRSKKTSDVIFSGSDKKARLGMAEVTLTLDNSAGQVPIDFTEIEITRRAYRDGDNEYLLNGKRVRLQDITEILAQTGLSKRTYAVIGQGLIDRVLNLAPEERRTLFEEAAGITGYQHKRTTTLSRLEATQQNLTRVRDILSELTPRLKYLKRQADRAREYEAIASDLRSMLRDWYGYRWHTTLATLEQNRRSEAELRQIVSQRQQALRRLEAQLTELRTRHAALREELADLHQASSTHHQSAEQNSREVAVANERLHQLQARRTEADQEILTLQQEAKQQQQRLVELQQALVTAESTFQTRQTAVTAAQNAVDERQQSRRQLEAALEEARRTWQQIQNELISGSSRLQQLTERRTQVAEEQRAQQTAQATAAQAAVDVEQKVTEAGQGLTAIEGEAQAQQAQIAALQMALTAAEQQLANTENQCQQATRALDRLQTRHDLLKRLHDEGAGFASGVRAIIQAGSQSDQAGNRIQADALTGILGVVATLVHVPAQLDKAIETALGGALQNIVTATWQATQAAIDYLKRTGRGRATFLPLDRIHVPSPITAPRAAGILGNAADLVEYDKTVAAAIEQLLNRVWVAEDLPAARHALDNLRNNLRPTVVTLEAEIIRPGGAVTGGNDSSRRDDSILARERELRALPAQLQQAARALTVAQKARANHQQQIDEARQQISTRQTAVAELARQERQQRQSVEALRRDFDRAQQTVQWHRERLGQSGAEITQLEQQLQRLEAEQAQQRQAAQAAQQAFDAAEAAVQAAGVNELLQEVADLRAAAAEAQAHWRNQKSLYETQQRTLQRLGQQLQNKSESVHRLEAEAQSLSVRLQELVNIEAGLRAQLDALRQQIEPLATQLATLEENRSYKESVERETQQALRKDESNWNNARLQLQRAEDALQQLQHEIEQDLGLVAFEENENLAYQPPLPWDTIVEQLPVLHNIPDGFADEVRETRARLSRVSNVNPEALREYDEAAERHEFLTTQSDDLEAAITEMRKVVKELDVLMEAALKETFGAVAEQFVHFFQRLFNGGTAQLLLTTPEDITNSGIEIIARPPGKRPQTLALLSGGERTLAACALIFAILRVSPTPFCVLDEVDAALDEANVDRFRLTVESLSDNTQFIIVTHNRRTLEGAGAIYGVTMGNDGISRVISLRLDGDKIVHRDNGANANGSAEHSRPENGDRTNGDGQVAAQLKTIEEFVKM